MLLLCLSKCLILNFSIQIFWREWLDGSLTTMGHRRISVNMVSVRRFVAPCLILCISQSLLSTKYSFSCPIFFKFNSLIYHLNYCKVLQLLKNETINYVLSFLSLVYITLCWLNLISIKCSHKIVLKVFTVHMKIFYNKWTKYLKSMK